MKKNDLKNDPLREKLLEGLSFLSKNKNASVAVLFAVIAVMAFIVLNSESASRVDYSSCFDVSKNSNIEEYCQQEIVKNALLDIKKDKSSNQNLLLLIDGFSKKSNNERLEYFNKIDFEKIKSSDLKSMLHKVYGDILFDENKNNDAIEQYTNALKNLDNKKTYSALLNYKIASVYSADEQYSKARDFLNRALDCDLGDNSSAIYRDIERLSASLSHALK